MDEIVESMLKAYLDAFDSVQCDNPKVEEELDRFKDELITFAQSTRDVTEFMERYESEGYSKRYLDLFGIIARSQASELTVEEIEERQKITPVEFAAQYTTAYEAVKASGYRVKAEQAYRNIFELAERSEDMLDFNIECERGNLLFKLAADDAVEQIEFIMEASDLLDKIAYAGHERTVKNWQQSKSDADITYYSDLEKEEVVRNTNREMQRMTVIIGIALFATEYVAFKKDVLSASRDRAVYAALEGMMRKRKELRHLVEEMLPALGLSFETVFNDKYYRRLLLSPLNLDATGRIKRTNHPQNVEAIKEIIVDEVLSDKSIAELVFRLANTPYYFSIVRGDRKATRKYERKAKEMNANLIYYKQNTNI